MKPSQVASKLRQIAITIEESRQPRRGLVIEDLRRIIAAVSDDIEALDEEVSIFKNKASDLTPEELREQGREIFWKLQEAQENMGRERGLYRPLKPDTEDKFERLTGLIDTVAKILKINPMFPPEDFWRLKDVYGEKFKGKDLGT